MNWRVVVMRVMWATCFVVHAALSIALIPAFEARAQEKSEFEVVAQAGHTDRVISVTFSPDGSRLLSGSLDRTLKLWDVASGQLLRTFHGHSHWVGSVAFSPDGQRAVSSSYDKTVKLWDVATATLLRTFQGHTDRLASVAFSPDGASVASGSYDGEVRLWQVTTGALIHTLKGGEIFFSLAFSPDGRRLLGGGSHGDFKIWDVEAGTQQATFRGYKGWLYSLGFSRDGRSVLSSGDDGVLRMWDAATGLLLRAIEVRPGSETVAALSPEGKHAVSGSGNGALQLWDLAAGTVSVAFEGVSKGGVKAVAFSSDGRSVASSGWDKVIKLWDANSGKLLHTVGHGSAEVTSVAFSADGKSALSGSGDKTLKLWDATLGELLRTFEGHSEKVNAVAISPDGRTAASGSQDGALKLWEVATGRLVRDIDTAELWINSVAFSPDGTHVLSVGKGDLTLSNAKTGARARTFKGLVDGAVSAVFSPAGDYVLADTVRNTALMWQTKSGKQLRAFSTPGEGFTFLSVAFSPDGKRVLGGGEESLLVMWDAATGRQLRKFENSHRINSVAFSPDGKRVLAGGMENALKLWDADTGILQHSRKGHLGPVTSVVFSRDGSRILSGSTDGTVRVWEGLTGELLATLVASSEGEWCVLTPEGFFAASPNGARLLSIVRGLEVYSIDQFYQQLYRPDVVRQKLSSDIEINARVKVAAGNVNLGLILASKAPPDTAIISPVSNAEINEGSTTVEVNLTDRGPEKGGGIGRIEWRVNDVTRAVQDLQRIADGTVTKVMQKLFLPEGTSEIQLVAYNRANLVASLPVSISVTVKSPAPRPKPRLHVLAVGVNAYRNPDIRQLRYSVADAKSIAAAFALSKSDKQTYEDVAIHGPLLDADVTARSLQAEFERLSMIVRPDDVFTLYLAGHGVTDDGRYYFVPHDAKIKDGGLDISTGIEQGQLQKWLTLIPAFKSVLIFDTCESGSITEERSAFRGTRQLVATEKLSRSMGRTVLSATSDVKAALEGYRNHGVFTYVLLDALALADDNKDGAVTTDELAAYVRRHLPALAEKVFKFPQEPQVRLSGVPFTLVRRADIVQINELRR